MAAGRKGRTKDFKNARIWKNQCSGNGLRAPEWDAGLTPSSGCGLGRGLLGQSRGDRVSLRILKLLRMLRGEGFKRKPKITQMQSP